MSNKYDILSKSIWISFHDNCRARLVDILHRTRYLNFTRLFILCCVNVWDIIAFFLCELNHHGFSVNKNGELLAKLEQRMSSKNDVGAGSRPDTRVQLSVDIPSKGIHKQASYSSNDETPRKRDGKYKEYDKKNYVSINIQYDLYEQRHTFWKHNFCLTA